MFCRFEDPFYSSIGSKYYGTGHVLDCDLQFEQKGTLAGRGYYATWFDKAINRDKPAHVNLSRVSQIAIEAKTRKAYLKCFTLTIETTITDGAIGLPSAALSLCALGQFPQLNLFAYRQLKSFSRLLFSAPFENLLPKKYFIIELKLGANNLLSTSVSSLHISVRHNS